jgi:hypothetical protein
MFAREYGTYCFISGMCELLLGNSFFNSKNYSVEGGYVFHIVLSVHSSWHTSKDTYLFPMLVPLQCKISKINLAVRPII